MGTGGSGERVDTVARLGLEGVYTSGIVALLGVSAGSGDIVTSGVVGTVVAAGGEVGLVLPREVLPTLRNVEFSVLWSPIGTMLPCSSAWKI